MFRINNKIAFLLILTEFVVVFLLALNIINKRVRVLGESTSISPIKKEDLIFKSNNKLRYYYEPRHIVDYKPNRWSPYQGIYTINKDTLNDRYTYSVTKPKDSMRIVALGDSFTFGLYVNTENNWTEKLEDLLNVSCGKFEVINLGVHGYDLQYASERYKSRGKKYEPDLILWFIIDPKRMNEVFFPLITKYENKMNKNSYEPWGKARDEVYETITDDQLYQYQIGALNQLDNDFKGTLVLMMEQQSNNWPENTRKIFFDYASKRKNTVIFNTITNTFNSSEYHFPTDPHPNEKGHQKIAQDVFNYLTINKIVPCN